MLEQGAIVVLIKVWGERYLELSDERREGGRGSGVEVGPKNFSFKFFNIYVGPYDTWHLVTVHVSAKSLVNV